MRREPERIQKMLPGGQVYICIRVAVLLLSLLFTPMTAVAKAGISLSADTVATGEVVEITLNDLPGNRQDWVSLARVGQADNQYLSYRYLQGATDTSWSFRAPAPGQYEVRLYFDWPAGGYNPVLRLPLEVVSSVDAAESSLIVMPKVDLSSETFRPGQPIEVRIEDLPGNRKDWVAIARAGSADDQYVDFDYSYGVTKGKWTYRLSEPGDYEVRVYLNWPDGGYNPVLRQSITVSPADVPSSTAVPPAEAADSGATLGAGLEEQKEDLMPVPSGAQPRTRLTASEIALEAEQVVEHCETHGMFSVLNDCDCIGQAFIRLREQTPYKDLDPLQVANQIPDSACPDADGIRSYYFRQCGEQNMRNIGAGLDAFCSCYADEVASGYLSQPSSAYAALSGLGSAAILSCDQRGLPSPLNPNRDYNGPLPPKASTQLDNRGFLPLPEGLCRLTPSENSRPAMDRFRACQKAKYPEDSVNPGYELNVDYHLCLWTRLHEVTDRQQGVEIENACKREYGAPQRYVGN